MPTIDTRPTNVDILCYAGDTLTLNITSSVDYSGHTWTGQVKVDSSSPTVDAEFSFVHDTGSTIATLSAEDTAALGLAITQALSIRSTKAGINTQAAQVVPSQYTGVWDIQVQLGGVVTTLVRGSIKVDTDVTRL